jgi:hypothetical protein
MGLETAANKVVYSKRPQLLKKRTQKSKTFSHLEKVVVVAIVVATFPPTASCNKQNKNKKLKES